VFAYRDFWAIDSEGNTLAYAGSTWTLMNLETRKMAPIPKRMFELQEVDPGQKVPMPAQKLRLPETLDTIYTHHVGHYDLDWNGHVNNVVVARLLLQGVPSEVYLNQRLRSYKFHVKSEVMAEQTLTIGLKEQDGVYFHQLQNEEGKVLAVATSEWDDRT